MLVTAIAFAFGVNTARAFVGAALCMTGAAFLYVAFLIVTGAI
jgi:hypothetical protein